MLAGSNTYGFGRLSWDPSQTSEEVNREWSKLSFPAKEGLKPAESTLVVDTITDILQKSRAGCLVSLHKKECYKILF